MVITPAISVVLAFLVKIFYDRYFEREQTEYNARKWRRLAKLQQVHLDPGYQYRLQDPSVPPPSSYPYPYTFRRTLLQFISHIKTDFVLPWYSRISPSSTFPEALEQSILHFVDAAARRLSSVDAAEVVASRFLPKITKHFDEYRKLEHLLHSSERLGTSTASPSRHGSTPSSSINVAAILQANHKHLHPALPATALSNPMPSVEAYLRSRVVEPLLKALLREEDAQSPAVFTIAREIITCSILLPLVDMLAEPDFWNQLIDDKLDPYLQERKQVSQLRRAIETASMAKPEDLKASDQASPGRLSPDGRSTKIDPLKTPVKSRVKTISVRTDAKSFDVFLSSIPKVQSLAEAKRLRNDLDREMRTLKNAALLSGRTVSEEQTRKEEAHLKRLEKARRRIDKRIEKLGSQTLPYENEQPEDIVAALYEPSLTEVLDDAPSSTIFSDFLGIRHESHLIRFWMAVRSLRTPLDQGSPTEAFCMVNSDVAYDDLSLLWVEFLDSTAPERVNIKTEEIAAIGDMLAKDKSSVNRQDILQAQQAAFKAQKEIYEFFLKDSFPAFKETDLYRQMSIDLRRRNEVSQKQRGLYYTDADPAASHVFNPLPSSSSQSGQPQKWLSLSSHFPSFSKARTVNEDENIAVETPQDDDTQITPKRPTALRGRARRISNVFNSMRSPSSTDSGAVNPALGFLIGSPPDHANDARRSIFGDDAHEDDKSKGVENDGKQQLQEADEDVELQRMEAIQVALTSIMEKDARSRDSKGKDDNRQSMDSLTPRRSRSSLFSESIEGPQKVFDPLGARQSFDNDSFLYRPQLTRNNPGQRKSVVGVSPDYRRRERVFDDAEEDDDEVSIADSVEMASSTALSRKLSGISDVQLPLGQLELGKAEIGVEVDWVDRRLSHLREQDSMLDKMIRAADLKGSVGQHRLLVTSQSDLRLEMRALALQKQQYEQLQQNSVIHPNQTKIHIPTATVLAEEAGKQIVRYLVAVEQQGTPDSEPVRWTIPRRFNEFFTLHQTLKSDPHLAEALRKKNIDIPAKKLMPKLSEAFVETRRVALEKYLLNLLQIPLACESLSFRRFLSQSSVVSPRKPRGFKRNATPSPSKVSGDAPTFYQSFTSSIDDILTKPSMLNTVSENFGKQAGTVVGKWDASVVQAGQLGLDWGANILSPMVNPLIGGLADPAFPFGFVDVKMGGSDSLQNVSRQTTFVGQLSDLLFQLLDYKDSDWLRKPALKIILQHFMGNTIERKLRDRCASVVSAEAWESHLAMIQDIMWPDGTRRSPSLPRTDVEKSRTKHSAASKIQATIPDIAANMIGRSHLKRAVRRVFGILQVRILNLHLLLGIIDELTEAILKGSTKDIA
ncbi:hypothetical protein NliqN6_5345 [Naganishia liquefaciens]|uniref:PX domain-containing protein n=1 Tax=Naganishia liquefaciens TaxID=104408 RepID=A0A8H3YH37_9TREE|nr:hypothetical protein NliqN6_5345 [Naganishia liquefaciens]